MEAKPFFVAYHNSNPSRPLAWRWMRAQFLAATGRRGSPRKDDADTLAAAAYLRAQARCRDDADRAQVGGRWPDIAAAERLATERCLLWGEVCARILAAQSDAEIADRCGLSAQTVRTFEALFFHTRDRLRATDWVASQVLGPGFWLGYRPTDLAGVWMVLAFAGGPLVLDAVIAVTAPNRGSEARPGRCNEEMTAMNDRLRQSVRLAVAGLMIPRDASLRQLSQIYTRAQRREGRPVGVNVPKRIMAILSEELERRSSGRPKASRGRAPAAAVA